MNRMSYAIKHAFRFRKSIKDFFLKRDNVVNTVTELAVENLDSSNIKVLALDFDGVLASHGKLEIRDDVYKWLTNISKQYGGKIVILSNKPSIERSLYFNRNFPKIDFICKVAKKPYPDGLLVIKENYKVKIEEVLLVDDRILTGLLATILAGCKCKYVNKPFVDYSNNIMAECFFSLLRFIERSLFIRNY